MYVRRSINVRHLFHDSWIFLLGATAWSMLILYVNEFLGWHYISIPILPASTIGIAVSLYLGFKNTSAYNRWWEARIIWGNIIGRSRDWGNSVLNLIHSDGKRLDRRVQNELIERHIAWTNALAYQMRRTSRLKEAKVTRIFGHRPLINGDHIHQSAESYRRCLPPEEAAEFEKYTNIAAQILRRQGECLKALAEEGFLDSYRHVAMMAKLDELYTLQGQCERIKNTPFPRQVANFGLMFTWVFIVSLPLAFVDVFEADTRFHNLTAGLSLEYMLVMVPFTVLISWVFFLMEKVSDSIEDPFEGGVTDVPISALCRLIEIDLKEMMEAEDVPERLKPIDGVLY